MTPRARRRWRREVRQIRALALLVAAILALLAVLVSGRTPGASLVLGLMALGCCRLAREAGDEIRSWRTDNARWLVALDPSSGEPNGLVWRRIGKVVEIRPTEVPLATVTFDPPSRFKVNDMRTFRESWSGEAQISGLTQGELWGRPL